MGLDMYMESFKIKDSTIDSDMEFVDFLNKSMSYSFEIRNMKYDIEEKVEQLEQLTDDDLKEKLSKFINKKSEKLDQKILSFNSYVEASGFKNLISEDYLVDSEKIIQHYFFYWRKANQIHKWFCDNVVPEYGDDQALNLVTLEDINNLEEACKTVLESKTDEVSKSILPSEEGFFFGSTNYDEYYYSDVENTLGSMIPKAKELIEDGWVLTYTSWW